MGAFDYEKSKEEEIAGSTRNQRTTENTIYLNEYGRFTTMQPAYIANVINRPVYTYTRLREDIFYIHCKIFEEKSSISYIIAVNEKSFWKRFTILYENRKIIKEDGISVREIIQKCLYNPNKYHIQLNIYQFEQLEIQNCNGDIDKLCFFKNGALVKFTNFRCKNKRLWLNYLKNGAGLTHPALANLGEPGDNNYETNGGKFDIESDKYKKYAFFID